MDNYICMLTTFDNPYDPFTHFDEWFAYDIEKGYYSCSRLARIADLNSEMTQKEREEEADRAMNLIVSYDEEGIFYKGTKEQIDKWIKLMNESQKDGEKQTATATNA